jgi:hypothetical protein
MGMTVHYKHITHWLLSLLAQQPELVEPFTALSSSCSRDPGDPNRLKRKRKKEFDVVNEIEEAMREEIRNISPNYAQKILEEAKSDGFTLYKYFENVQFHISGEIADHGATLLSQAVTGGENIGNDVWPYGPATFLSKEDVRKVAKELSTISEHEFLTKHSPDDWDEETTQYALDYFKGFVFYYNEALKAGHAMLVWGA